MKKLYFLILITLSLFINGCSSSQVRDNVDGLMQRTSGNKPPQFFMFENPKTADLFTLEHKYFTAKAPVAYAKDWAKMTPWKGGLDRTGGFISLNQYGYTNNHRWIALEYLVQFFSYSTPYTNDDRALEKGDETYFKNKYPQGKDKDNREYYVNYHIEHHGKENYPCEVFETYKPKYGKKIKHTTCYKYNPERTKKKNIAIEFVYTNDPDLPKELEPLTKEYTYEDLLQRSQRVLDSLYIKDGWDD